MGNFNKERHLLETIKCYDFFGLEFDESLLENIQVLEEDFELFLDVIDIIGYNEITIKLINKNLPKDYDLTKFPKELLNEMYNETISYNIIGTCWDYSIRIWNQDGKMINYLKDHTDLITYVGYSPDNECMISASKDCTIKFWNAVTNKSVDTCTYHADNQLSSMCCSSDNKYFIVGFNDKSIHIYELTTKKRITTIRGHTSTINSICCSHDNKYILSGSNDNTIRVWKFPTGTLINTLLEHTAAVTHICYSVDNNFFVSGSDDHTIRLWDAKIFSVLLILANDIFWIKDLYFSPNNKYVVSICSDRNIKIWNIQTTDLNKIKTPTNILNKKCEYIWSSCCLPISESDQQYIVIATSDNVQIYNIETGNLIKKFDKSVHSIRCIKNNECDLEKRIKKIIMI
jgi:WD40 repeat protein